MAEDDGFPGGDVCGLWAFVELTEVCLSVDGRL